MDKVVTVKWLDEMQFVANTASGHSVVMDAAPEVGGQNLAARPMEMVLVGLGGCTAIDVVMMLQKSKQDIVDCHIEVSAERSDSIPKVFTKIHLLYKIYGRNLEENKVERAVKLSAEKYCSVSKMLEQAAEMSYSFEMIEKN